VKLFIAELLDRNAEKLVFGASIQITQPEDIGIDSLDMFLNKKTSVRPVPDFVGNQLLKHLLCPIVR
jgi:hypothetical protein